MIIKMAEQLGLCLYKKIITFSRDADRQVVSDTIGLVNQQLRGLKEQLALRLKAGDSFDY